MDLNAIYDNICKFLGDTVTYLVENTDVIAFAIIALIAVVAALYVVTSKEVMHSAFYLALVFTCVAVTYYFLNAELVGVIQMMVYVGAITILFSFSVMLTRRTIKGSDEEEEE